MEQCPFLPGVMVKPEYASDPSKGIHSVDVESESPPISKISELRTALVCFFLLTKVLVNVVQELSTSLSHVSSRQLTTVLPTVSRVKEDLASNVSSKQVSKLGDQISGKVSSPPTIKRASG